ncbi:MAG: amino acid racemase [Pseudomonadota bacterium]
MASSENLVRQPTIGVLGGTSHIVTPAYYQLINQAAREHHGGDHIAETLIAGMNYGNIRSFIFAGDWDGLAQYVGTKVDALEAAGVDLVIGSSNTTHLVMDDVMKDRSTPFLPITQPVGEAIAQAGLKKVAIFGTQTTMQGGKVMNEIAEISGAEIIAPRPEEQDEIHRIIFEELCEETFLDASRKRYREIALRMKNEDGAEGLILGCTEIFLLLTQGDLPEMAVFASAVLHAEAAVAQVLKGKAQQAV